MQFNGRGAPIRARTGEDQLVAVPGDCVGLRLLAPLYEEEGDGSVRSGGGMTWTPAPSGEGEGGGSVGVECLALSLGAVGALPPEIAAQLRRNASDVLLAGGWAGGEPAKSPTGETSPRSRPISATSSTSSYSLRAESDSQLHVHFTDRGFHRRARPRVRVMLTVAKFRYAQ